MSDSEQKRCPPGNEDYSKEAERTANRMGITQLPISLSRTATI